MKDKRKKNLRRLLEIAHYYAWGVDGNADLRKEWHKLYHELKKETGMLVYILKGKTKWIDKL